MMHSSLKTTVQEPVVQVWFVVTCSFTASRSPKVSGLCRPVSNLSACSRMHQHPCAHYKSPTLAAVPLLAHTKKYCTHWRDSVTLLLRFLCLTRLSQPEFSRMGQWSIKQTTVSKSLGVWRAVTHYGYIRARLTPSLPWCHLKTAIKSAILETLKAFRFLFRTFMWKDFHKNAQHWE